MRENEEVSFDKKIAGPEDVTLDNVAPEKTTSGSGYVAGGVALDKGASVCTVSAGQDGVRLDAVLAGLFPEFGLRARRRLWEWRRITVDGTLRQPAYKVRAGQVVRVLPGEEPEAQAAPDLSQGLAEPKAAQVSSALREREQKSQETQVMSVLRQSLDEPGREAASRALPRLRLVAVAGGFAALAKPAGLPSAALAGGEGDSAEALLQSCWGELWREFVAGCKPIPYDAQPLRSRQSVQASPKPLDAVSAAETQDASETLRMKDAPETPLLCNRLDTATSGLLLLAFGRERLEFFRACERRGEAVKKYLALAQGHTPQSLYLDRAMDTDGRKRTRVLDRAEPDHTRHTAVTLRQHITLDQPGLCGEFSLLEVTIRRGARHQIRAQLAAAGFPLAGDTLYGRYEPDLEISSVDLTEPNVSKRMYLHHFELSLPGFTASWLPDWDFRGGSASPNPSA